jgi:type I restriction enzyme S subunit
MSWEKVKLGSLIEVLSGFAFDSKKFNTSQGTPLIRIRDIKRSYSETFFLGEFDPKFLVNSGDILIGMDGEFNIAEWKGSEALLNQRVCKVKVTKDSLLDKRYLLYFLPFQLKIIEDKASFVTVKHLSVNDINNIQIPLPPLATQKRIAEILDAADALRRKDQELLKKYDELAQAIFIDMFGDPVKNEKGWKIRKLGELFSASVKCGPFGSALKKEEYISNGIPVWIMDNIQDYAFNQNGCLYITESKYNDLKSYLTKNGDVIISRAGTVGKMCVIKSEFNNSIISTNLIKISLEESLLNPYFFVTLMKYFGKKIGRLRTGSENGFTHMNTGVLAGLEFPLPDIKTQNEFISVLESISIQTGSLYNKPEHLFNSLIQKAFKGELVN